MLNFTQNKTNDYAVVTLTEKATLTNAYYLFVFTHVTTREVITQVIPFANDLSTAQKRYNKFLFNTNVLFANKSTGQYLYDVYEQVSAINVDPAQAGTWLETGKMNLAKAIPFGFKKYDTTTTFKAYAG